MQTCALVNSGRKKTCGRILLHGKAELAVRIFLLVFGLVCTTHIHPQAKAEDSVARTPEFEVASVRLMQDRDKLPIDQQLFSVSPPGALQFRMRNTTLSVLIAYAFGISSNNQIAGKPNWLDDTFYEIAAKSEGDVGLSHKQMMPLLQQLLQERFHFAYHRETRNIKGYALVVAKGGPKLKVSKSDSPHAYLLPGMIDAADISVFGVASLLAHPLGAPVANKTGLAGKYDFQLEFARLEDTDSSKPSIFAAIQEQLGLKLEAQMVPVEVLVIDHVERVPTEN